MSVDAAYPHLETPPGQPARLSRIPRIRVVQIAMDYLAHAWSADEICRQYPHLKPSEVHSAMAYYFDHQEEMDREIQDEWEQIKTDRGELARSPFFMRMRAKGTL